jgi:hypothetical protein
MSDVPQEFPAPSNGQKVMEKHALYLQTSKRAFQEIIAHCQISYHIVLGWLLEFGQTKEISEHHHFFVV